ncbi:hypothetical protein PENANT_c057G00294 [Penicillium antarcticum]|uniref:Uncharacterized protein n=1 Tax=Penicillium antarcticum TaxID=416450 RepID=A0A1V6PQI0_9EURO|nr:uncharacterized protein N7508_006840 [Penicillium antarcticum]KAJ5301977.1 hypothetical protein N7508_006840 [Penicillium antarcticum]OQD79234.1 hypothetical protein PENANT_c057G00294 [Penicillium antarcticum]
MSGMAYIHPTRGTPLLRLGTQSLRPHHAIRPSQLAARTLHSLTSTTTKVRPATKATSAPSLIPQTIIRSYTDLKGSTGKAEADLLIEELQELYEIAKDEFEIATESTDTGTIYAASDRESARDALNQLSAVYHLYTARPGEVESENGNGNGADAAEDDGDGTIIETNYNPAEVPRGVKDEVRRRVGQRIRELKNAVELLEERAHEE